MKFSQESIILIIAAIAIGALIVWKNSGQSASAISPESPVDTAGDFSANASPAYTSYNNPNAAYNFGPPIVNALPQQTSGFAGVAAKSFGCKTCG